MMRIEHLQSGKCNEIDRIHIMADQLEAEPQCIDVARTISQCVDVEVSLNSVVIDVVLVRCIDSLL